MSDWNSDKTKVTTQTVEILLQQLIQIKLDCRSINRELKIKHDLMLAAREWRKLKIRQRYLQKQHCQIEENYIILKLKNQ
jgi:hypothetical protein